MKPLLRQAGGRDQGIELFQDFPIVDRRANGASEDVARLFPLGACQNALLLLTFPVSLEGAQTSRWKRDRTARLQGLSPTSALLEARC